MWLPSIFLLPSADRPYFAMHSIKYGDGIQNETQNVCLEP